MATVTVQRDPLAAVLAAGGVARSSTLIRSGVSKYAIADAVTSGRLVRVRRVWVALPDADPHIVSAAREGVVLTCVTRAQRLGLWALGDGVPHVAAPPHSGMIAVRRATVHRHRPLVPRHPDELEDSVENALALVAVCQPHERALAIWDSALRLGLADAVQMSRYDLGEKARRLLAEASAFRDSGLETFVVVRLRFLRLPLVWQVWIRGHLVDLLIGERLVLQIDGGHHVGAQRARDVSHDAELALMGYHVIRVTYAQVIDEWPYVLGLILRAVGQGLHRADR
jgi:very-short-patch-repair endonuclease